MIHIQVEKRAKLDVKFDTTYHSIYLEKYTEITQYVLYKYTKMCIHMKHQRKQLIWDSDDKLMHELGFFFTYEK